MDAGRQLAVLSDLGASLGTAVREFNNLVAIGDIAPLSGKAKEVSSRLDDLLRAMSAHEYSKHCPGCGKQFTTQIYLERHVGRCNSIDTNNT